jgi:oxygen-independent coproporphyrinogen-3 oxidase
VKKLSLYVHVPFCKRRCAYCTFYHVPHITDFETRFVASLLAEWRAAVAELGDDVRVSTVFVGGGTPSVLRPESLERIMRALAPYVETGAEITVEANPEDVTAASLDHLARMGVNRLSLGVQSMSSRALTVLKRCGRDINAQAIELVQARFENFSIDLLLGVPGSSTAEVRLTLARVREVAEPGHFSVYCLEPGGVMAADVDGFFDHVDPEQSAEQYLFVSDALSSTGYTHYEVSNFARPGFESRHNRVYWRGGDYLGLGPAAHSFLDGERYRNEASVERYVDGAAPPRVRDVRSGEQRRTEALMLALRTGDGLPVQETTCPSQVIDDLVASGLAGLRDDRLVLTDRGFLVLNEILLRVSGDARHLDSNLS